MTETPNEPVPFSRLGHYEIVARIGRGGMGDVFRAYDPDLKRPVAIKVLPSDLAGDHELVRRFKAEATAAARLIHPNIIQIHFIGEDAGHHFFAMQFVEGESLADLLARRQQLSVEETLAIAAQALSALAAAHEQGMVHRDIKPGNILLDRHSRRAHLADFGLVKSLGSSVTRQTATGVIMGTVDYISPEQGRGQTVDGRSDLYSMGVLLYQMLSGRLPFAADSPTQMVFQHVYEKPPSLEQIAPHVPARLASIVEKLLAKSPSDRHQTAKDVLAELSAIPTDQPTTKPADFRPPPVFGGHFPPGRRAIVGLAAGCVAAIALILAFWAQRKGTPDGGPATGQTPAAGADEASSDTGTALLRTTIAETPAFEASGNGMAIVAVRYASDGRLITSALADGSVEFRNATSGELLKTIKTGVVPAMGIALSSDGQTIAGWAVTDDETNARANTANSHLQVWTLRDGDRISTKTGLPRGARPLSISDKPEVLLALNSDRSGNQLVRWSVTNHNEIDRVALPDGDIGACQMNDDASMIVFALNRKHVVVGRRTDGNADFTFQNLPTVGDVLAFHPARPWLCVGSADGIVTVWDFEHVRPVARLQSAAGPVLDAAIDATGRRLAVVTAKHLCLWDLGLDYVRAVIPIPDVRAVDFRPDGKQLLTGSLVGGLAIWDSECEPLAVNFDLWIKDLAAKNEGEFETAIKPRLPNALPYDPRSALTADGRLRALAPGDKIPFLEDARTGEVLHEFPGATPCLSIAVSPVGRLAATGSWNQAKGMGDVRLWDLRSGTQLKEFTGHVHYAWSVAISPDESRLLSGGRSNMHLWDIATAKELHRFPVPIPFVQRVSFSADGRLGVASQTTTGMNKHFLFDLETGDELLEYTGPYPEMGFTTRDLLCDRRFGRLDRLEPAPIPATAAASTAVTIAGGPADPKPATSAMQSGESSDSSAQPRIVADHVRRALQTAYREMTERGIGTPDFQQALQSIAADLPEVEVSVGDVPPKWNRVELNTAKEQIDAYRFRSPLNVPADMHWVFALPGKIGRWYILPATGTMSGFNSFESQVDIGLSGVELPRGSTVIFQTLLHGRIEPGRDYILWHAPAENVPVEMAVAINLSPAGTRGDDRSVSAIAKAIGLEVRRPEFEQTPEGLRDAFKTARDLAKRRLPGSDAFRHALQSVRQMLPEIRVSPETGKLTWNHVVPDASYLFHAVRFTSPLEGPAGMHSILVAPFALPTWQILPAEGEMPPFEDFRLEVNVTVPELALPDENVALLQAFSDGRIEPGREYILWFMPSAGALSDLELAIRLNPTGRHPTATTATAMAANLGLDLPALPSPKRIQAALRRCRRLLDSQKANSWEFARLLEFIYPALPELDVGDSRGVWNSLTIEPSSARIAAWRFASPLDQPADLVSAVTGKVTLNATWAFVSLRPDRFHNPWRIDIDDVRIDGLELPEHNTCTFQTVTGGHVGPRAPQVLYFATGEESSLDVSVALRVAPAGSLPFLGSPRAVATNLGFDLPTPAAVPGSQILGRHGDAVWSAAYSANGELLVTGSTDGTVRLWDPASGTQLKELRCSHKGIRAIGLSADGTRLATLDTEFSEVIVWDLTMPEPVPQRNFAGRAHAIALSPDGIWLAISDGGWVGKQRGRPSTIKLHNLENGETTELTGDKRVFTDCVTWLADSGKLIAAGMYSDPKGEPGRNLHGVITIFDRRSGNALQEITDDICGWSSIAVSSDGMRLVGIKDSCVLRVWDLPSGKEVASVAQDGWRSRASVSPDGKLIATVNADGTVRVWDGETLRLRRTMRGHVQASLVTAFSPDGQSLASGGKDTTVRIWDLASQPPHAQFAETDKTIVNSIGMKLTPIPAGEFMMGSPASFKLPDGYERDFESEQPQHPVRISKPFYLAAHEVTVRQFRAFVDETGYRTTAETSGLGGEHIFESQKGYEARPGLNWKSPGFEQTDDHPVVQVSWHDAVAFCDWLGKKENAVYRLPTEAEWEYACRAGSTTTFSFGEYQYFLKWCGNGADNGLRQFYGQYPVADVASDGFTFTAPVGSYLPNAFGLYDMHGNVLEWCSDWFGQTYYAMHVELDPSGPASGTTRVQRGGAWTVHGIDTRSSYRDLGPPDQAQSALGFRVARDIPKP